MKNMRERCIDTAQQHTPEGWDVNHDYDHGRHTRARAWLEEQRLDVPEPTNRHRLFTFLHECGHAHLHADLPWRLPYYILEYQADQCADSVQCLRG